MCSSDLNVQKTINPVNNVIQNPIQQNEAQDDSSEKTAEKAHYSEQVQSMIEQFNGRIIE